MQQKTPRICPVCRETSSFIFITDNKNDSCISSLFECKKCNTQFWIPFQNMGGNWYEHCEVNVERANKIVDTKFVVNNSWNTRQFLKSVKASDGEKVLDAGCGVGGFLKVLKSKNFKTYGIDFDKNQTKQAKDAGLKNIYTGDVNYFLEKNLNKFNIITATELIEHLDNPLDFLQKARSSLVNNGLIYISTPNRNRHWGNITEYWDYPPHHLARFDNISMRFLLEKSGFEIVFVKEQPYDNYLIRKLLNNIQGLSSKSKKPKKDSNKQRKRGFLEIENIKYFYHLINLILFPFHAIIYLLGYRGTGLAVLARKIDDKRKIKVAFVCNGWLGDKGGGRKAVSLVLNNFDPDLYSLYLIDNELRNIRGDFLQNVKNGLNTNIKFMPIFTATRNPGVKILLSGAQIVKTLKDIKPDIVIDTSGPLVKSANVLYTKFFLSKSKIGYILFDHLPPIIMLEQNTRLHRLFTIVLKYAYSNADIIASVSKELAENTVNSLHLTNKCAYINNAVDQDQIKLLAKEKVDHPWFKSKANPIIISVARLHPIQKDFPTLIKAFSMLPVESRLVIVGEGTQKNDLIALTENLGVARRVWFTGFQENPYKYMSKADVFVLSSNFEAYPLTPIEAMVCNIPIVSSDCNFGPREILINGKVGSLVPVNDVKKMTDALTEILNNKEIVATYAKNYKDRLYDYSIQRVVGKYVELINETFNLKANKKENNKDY